MNNNNVFNALQIATGIAVVIGLIMVFVELRQAKSLSLAELTSEGYSEAMAELRAIMGENPAPTIAKACFTPEDLEPHEMVVLTAYYSGRIAQVSRLRVLEAVADFGVPWQALADQQLVGVLETEPGRIWFERNFKSDPQLYEIGQRIIASGVDCKQPLIPPGPELILQLE